MDYDRVITLEDRDGDRLPGALAQTLADRPGAAKDIEVGTHGPREQHQPKAKPVLLGRRILLDQSPVSQGREQPVRGRLVDVQLPGDLGYSRVPAARQELQNGDGPVNRLYRGTPAYYGAHKRRSYTTFRIPARSGWAHGYQNVLTSSARGKERGRPSNCSACPSRTGWRPFCPVRCPSVSRSSRKRFMSWRVNPFSARSAMISPTTLANLKPCPEQGEAMETCG